MQECRVVTVIPNWNLKADVGDCIESLQQSGVANHEIVVVDNASTNGASDYIRENYPGVTLFALKQNIGYAGALNVGIRHAISKNATHVFALNNDTIVPDGTIGHLIEQMQHNPAIGILAPKVVYFQHPDILFSLGAKTYPFLPVPIEFGHRWRDSKRFSTIMEYDYVTGCAMLIRTSLFKQVGYFDESYFMYYEDDDFCRRVRDKGYKIACDGSAKILHKASLSSKQQGAKVIYFRSRNRVLFYRRFRHGPFPVLTYLLLWIMAFWYTVMNFLKRRKEWNKPYWSGFLQGWHEPLSESHK